MLLSAPHLSLEMAQIRANDFLELSFRPYYILAGKIGSEIAKGLIIKALYQKTYSYNMCDCQKSNKIHWYQRAVIKQSKKENRTTIMKLGAKKRVPLRFTAILNAYVVFYAM